MVVFTFLQNKSTIVKSKMQRKDEKSTDEKGRMMSCVKKSKAREVAFHTGPKMSNSSGL